jgi:hypothetical protein
MLVRNAKFVVADGLYFYGNVSRILVVYSVNRVSLYSKL